MPEDGACPECATSVAFSTGFGRLDHADPLFLQQCAIGVTLLVIATLAPLLWSVSTVFSSMIERETLARIVGIPRAIGSGLQFLEPIALWFLLAPERYGNIAVDRTARSSVIRFIGVACALRFLSFHFFHSFSTLPHLLQGGLAIIVQILVYRQLRGLARRAGEPRLITQASIVMATSIASVMMVTIAPSVVRVPEMPTLIIVIAVFGVAIFAAAIWWKFRRMLTHAAERARDNWANRQPAPEVALDPA